MSLDFVLLLQHVGGSVLRPWSSSCHPGDDEAPRQNSERPGSHICGEHFQLHMERSGRNAYPKQSSSALFPVS